MALHGNSVLLESNYVSIAPSAPKITARWVNQFASILTSFNMTVSHPHF